jgi:hypothetical protein
MKILMHNTADDYKRHLAVKITSWISAPALCTPLTVCSPLFPFRNTKHHWDCQCNTDSLFTWSVMACTRHYWICNWVIQGLFHIIIFACLEVSVAYLTSFAEYLQLFQNLTIWEPNMVLLNFLCFQVSTSSHCVSEWAINDLLCTSQMLILIRASKQIKLQLSVLLTGHTRPYNEKNP